MYQDLFGKINNSFRHCGWIQAVTQIHKIGRSNKTTYSAKSNITNSVAQC